MSPKKRVDYFSGNSLFKKPWVRAFSTSESFDGLGPIFNTNSCTTCHIRNGRGSVQSEGVLLRLSKYINGRYVEDSLYGEQLQHRAIMGLKPEARWSVTWYEYNIMLANGNITYLRAPQITVNHWFLGEPDEGTRWSIRIAPPLIGLGLLEAIPEQMIVLNGQYQHNLNPAISGKPSWIINKKTGVQQLGRFGWKALHSTIKQQSAKAFSQDMGLTSSLYSESICTDRQVQCLQQASKNSPEVNDEILNSVTYYVSNSAVPGPRDNQSEYFKRGRRQFYLAGCAQCHQPYWRTKATAMFAAQDIWPYTDLLLHDMGDGLAAESGEGHVSGREWRTPPLWGIGLAKTVNANTGYLHDGRARTLMEAILWHGGEGEASRQFVRFMSSSNRDDLLYFLNSL